MMNNQEFIEENIKLVYFFINKYYPSFSKDEDIIQCGMLGLCKAAKKWKQEGEFSSYACQCVLNEVRQELKRRQKYNVEISLDRLLEEDKNDD